MYNSTQSGLYVAIIHSAHNRLHTFELFVLASLFMPVAYISILYFTLVVLWGLFVLHLTFPQTSEWTSVPSIIKLKALSNWRCSTCQKGEWPTESLIFIS